jgi:hypothetical protein
LTLAVRRDFIQRVRNGARIDCGISSSARQDLATHPTLVWGRFEAAAEAVSLATRELWGRNES